ncbi:transcription elongation factor SPT4-A [Strongylocentrotus purpuratus]|uniref:Transcription elongation factor SPT4 n=1 Tax=Strongylocentrotus purpuratus TaxID=7668 RepID=A0A7M7P6W7_STRPU|nr:transcription elongation factor SPT4-A [Strongylocentrotus purpuratus]
MKRYQQQHTQTGIPHPHSTHTNTCGACIQDLCTKSNSRISSALQLQDREIHEVDSWTNGLQNSNKMDVVPTGMRGLRACLVCSLIKTADQFEVDGCDNCAEFLQMKNNRDMVFDCTSPTFDGLISLMSPEDSWVAKWQRVNRCVKGCYAVSVTGELPKGMKQELKSRGVIYKSRDTSVKS